MTTGIISLVLWIVTILTYVFRNLWVRIQKLEKITQDQAAFIAETKTSVNQITTIFDTIDQENIFRANDYVGQMWLDLKALNEALKNYK
jgi:hypothetical protein